VLRLLLDEQLSPEVARQVRRHQPECDIVSLHTWQHGAYVGKSDDIVLTAARDAGLTLISRDVRSIYPLIVAWAEAGRSHAGVVFVDDKTIPERDLGGLVRAILYLWGQKEHEPWEDRVEFMRVTR
jgi:hypothetical protein